MADNSRSAISEHVIVGDADSTRTITMRRPEKKNMLTQRCTLP